MENSKRYCEKCEFYEGGIVVLNEYVVDGKTRLLCYLCGNPDEKKEMLESMKSHLLSS